MEIKTIALELNKLSRSHPIGHLQELRTRLRGKPSRTHAIFTESTIFPDYAFHDGGRHELQFNIGTEKIEGREVFRYGVAFSLETSRAHPDVSGLFPKIERFNYYLRTNLNVFPDFLIWCWSGTRSEDSRAQPIQPDWAKKGNFIFFGKWVDVNEVNLEDALNEFDRLMPLYTFVEGEDELPTPADNLTAFRPGCTVKKSSTQASGIATERDIALRHNKLQGTLYEVLVKEYGRENVGTEVPIMGWNKVDVAVRQSGTMTFFEIKIAPSARMALREAVGQLLEYAYWPNADRASELVVVAEAKPTKETKQYLDNVRRRFGLRLSYRQLNNEKGELGPIT